MLMTNPPPILVWLRNELRLADHIALRTACDSGSPVIPVFIWSVGELVPWAPGEASCWWLHHSLQRLDASLHSQGSRLILRQGAPLDCLRELVRETGAVAVHCTRSCEPALVRQDLEVAVALGEEGVALRSFPGALLADPDQVRTKSGTPFKVFTPFWRCLQARLHPASPLPAPSEIPVPKVWPASVPLASLGLLPRIHWASGFAEVWTPGEAGAGEALDRFLGGGIAVYDRLRDYPGEPGTSRLSPHLRFGEISPRMVWVCVQEHMVADSAPGLIRGGEAWLRQLGWREFAHHLLHHFPHTTDRPLRPEFEDFPWRDDPDSLRAWQRGQTGYPLVDAAMRELWTTGWMHNRVRMIAASFLVKDLLIPWQRGAEWFWNTLVDAELANNTLGWQWVAGCGADAAPFFRIFNPVSQADRFAGDGVYVRRWVPELAALPDRYLHRPWEAPAEALDQAGVRIGETCPRPIVDHQWARRRALGALQVSKGAA